MRRIISHLLFASLTLALCHCGGDSSEDAEQQGADESEDVRQENVTAEAPKQFFEGRLRLEQVVEGEVVGEWDVIATPTEERFLLTPIYRCEESGFGWCDDSSSYEKLADAALLDIRITAHIDPPGKSSEICCNGEGSCPPCGDRLWYERDLFQLGKTTEDVVLNDAFSLCDSGAPTHDVLSLELPAGEDSDPNLGISLELTQGCDDGSASSRSQVRVIATGDRAGY